MVLSSSSDFNLVYEQFTVPHSAEGTQNPLALDDAIDVKSIFDIKTQTVRTPANSPDFECLEYKIDETKLGIFSFHRRTPSDDLSPEVLAQAFDDWTLVKREKRRRTGRGGVLLYTPPPTELVNNTLTIEPARKETTSSKRYNVKEVRNRTAKHKKSIKDKIVPHADKIEISVGNASEPVQEVPRPSVEDVVLMAQRKVVEEYWNDPDKLMTELPVSNDTIPQSVHDAIKLIPGNLPKNGVASKWVHHMENLCLYAYGLCRAESLLDCFVATLSYIKMNFNRSICSFAAELVTAITTIDVKFIPMAGEWYDMRIMNSRWETLKTNTVFGKVKYLISAAMTLPVFDMQDHKFEWNPFGFKLMQIEAMKEQAKATDVIDAVIKTFTWVSETGIQIMKTGSLAPILYSDSRMTAFNNEYDWLNANGEFAIAGNFDDKIPGAVKNIHEFEKRLDDALKASCELKAVKTDGPTAEWVQKRYTVLMILKQKVVAKHRNTSLRECPIGFGLKGPTGVGKSTLASLTMKTSLNAMGYPYDPKLVLTKDMFDKYDSTYSSDILGLYMDDIGNGKPDFVERSPTDVIIKFFNNVAAQAVKAELNAKGVVFINFKCGVMTSNISDFGARHYSDCPESILRRFFHVDVKVQEKYCVSGGLSLDPNHPELVDAPLTKDVWILSIKECIAKTTDTGPVPTFRPVKIPDEKGGMRDAVGLTLTEYLKAVVYLSKRHTMNQKNVLKRVTDFETLNMCPKCCLPQSVCSCPCLDCNNCGPLCTCKVFRPQSDEIKDFVTSVITDSIKGYLKSFLSPSEFTWRVLGWRPITKMMTKELAYEVQRNLDYHVTPFAFSLVPNSVLKLPAFQRYVRFWGRRSAYYDLRTHFRVVWASSLAFTGLFVYNNRTSGDSLSKIVFPVSCLSAINLSLYAHYRTRAAAETEAYLERRDAISKDNDPSFQLTEVATIGIAVLGMGLKLFHDWYFANPTLPHAGEPKEDHPGWMGYYMQKIGFNLHPQKSTGTSTSKQLIDSLTRRNLFWAEYVRSDGTRTRCNIFFPRKGVALFPQHVWYADAIMRDDDDKPCTPTDTLTVTVHRHGSPGGVFTFVVDDTSCVKPPDMDLTCAFVPNCPDLRDMTKWFPETDPSGRVLSDIIVCQTKQNEGDPNTFDAERVEVTLGPVGHSGMSFQGGTYKTSLAKVGSCMGCIVSITKKPVLIGFHMGGTLKSGLGIMQSLSLIDYKRLVAQLEEFPDVVLSAQSVELPRLQYNKNILMKDTVHPNCMAASMNSSHCVEVYGSTQLRTVQKSTVCDSILSPYIFEICGVENKWGEPKLQPNWKGFNATLEHIANPPLMFAPKLLKRACEDWIKPLRLEMIRSSERYKPLSFEESVMGVAGKRFIDPLPMSTGMGFPVFGKKQKWFTDIVENGVLVNRIPHDCVKTEYERMLESWTNGERAYPVCSATLKDEPTKLDSEKVRVFQAAPVALSLHIRKYFLPIARFLSQHPTVSECAVGMNSFSPEWETIVNHAFTHDAEDGVLAWDYSKYDVRMSSQVVTAVLGLYIQLAELAGYQERDLFIMRMMISDIVHPLLDYNGVLLMAFNMNTSGNNITVNINSTAGSLYVRMGLFDAIPEVEDFRGTMACMTYGDDFIGSIKKDYHDRFNFEVYQKFLARHLMKITLPDKGSSSSAFMSIEDVDFLKRKSNFIPEIGRSIGKLDENSIFKSLHSNLKSKSATPVEVATSCVEGALHEWFAFGKDHYEMRREQMRRVCERANIPITVLDITFEDRVEHWREKYLQR